MADFDTSLIHACRALATLGILSWACGSRTFLGRPLALRMEPFWVGCRCFGIGLYIALVAVKPLDQQTTMIPWITCALCLLIGCVRSKAKSAAVHAAPPHHRNPSWPDP